MSKNDKIITSQFDDDDWISDSSSDSDCDDLDDNVTNLNVTRVTKIVSGNRKLSSQDLQDALASCVTGDRVAKRSLYIWSFLRASGARLTPSIKISACNHRNLLFLADLVNRGVDVDVKTIRGLSPLHYCAADGQDVHCNILLNKGLDVNARTRDGMTPLHYASMYGHPTVCRLLTQSDANPWLADLNGRTAFDLVDTLQVTGPSSKPFWKGYMNRFRVYLVFLLNARVFPFGVKLSQYVISVNSL